MCWASAIAAIIIELHLCIGRCDEICMPGLRLLWIVKWSRVVPIPRRSISPWG